jgi:hypothetical protein
VAEDPARGEGDLARDEDDHDLLTFSESGIRLREEISLTEAGRGARTGGARQARREGVPRLRAPAPGPGRH